MAVKRCVASIDVVQAAEIRITNVFSNGLPVYMSFSGGKDSLCLAQLVYNLVQRGKINPKQLIVQFIDEEAIFPCIEETVKAWRKRFILMGAKFEWYCLEVKHYNCFNELSNDETFVCWDSTKENVWVRRPPSFAIRDHKALRHRIDAYQDFLPRICSDGITITGIRTAESVQRLQNIASMVKAGKTMTKGNIKLVEIASSLGLPDNKIRKWKSIDNWEGKLHPDKDKSSKKKQVERSTKSKGSVPPKKRGAPLGNKNAVGGRGNPHPNTYKHGGYTAVFFDTLDDDEKELVEQVPQDEEELLLEQIQLFSIRERRIMQAINKYRKSDQPVAISYTSRSESKRTFDGTKEEQEADKEIYDARIREQIDKEQRLPGRGYDITTQTENKDNIIARLEAELSNVQAKKTMKERGLSSPDEADCILLVCLPVNLKKGGKGSAR